MQNNIPNFRSDLEVIPMSYQGQQGVLIRDFLGIIKETVFVHGAGLMVLSLMDGRRSVKDIQLESKTGGKSDYRKQAADSA